MEETILDFKTLNGHLEQEIRELNEKKKVLEEANTEDMQIKEAKIGALTIKEKDLQSKLEESRK